MKKTIFSILLLVVLKTEAQTFTIDTLKNALAFTNTYMPFTTYGTTRNGHIYAFGFINKYAPDGRGLPMTLVRIDLNTKAVTYKELKGTGSSTSALWSMAFDSKGFFYLGLNTNNRKIYQFNLKDSIYYKNLGNGFKDGNTLAYCIALGSDNNMYFGGSSGDPYVSEYNTVTGKMISYPCIDAANDYTLSIAGDADYIYAQTGQRNSIQLWAMKKSDSTKKMLFKIPNNTRMGLVSKKDGVYLSFNSDTLSGTWKLVHGTAIKFTGKEGDDMTLPEVNNGNLPTTVKSNYDDVSSTLSFSVNGAPYTDVHIPTENLKNAIRAVFSFKNDPENIYYCGDYYGNYYCYNIPTGKSTLLGKTSFNIYSVLQDTDSTLYFGNYPSGALFKWNRDKPWTLNRFINGNKVEASGTSNPRLIGYFKSQTPAGFHHLELLVKDFKGNIVGAGDVIRIGKTCSIAVYDPVKKTMYGYDFNKIKGLSCAGLAAWNQLVILSTDNYYGGTAKLYFYNSINNTMADSLNFGFADYGKIYINGNILTGIANDRVYKIDLAAKKLIANIPYNPKSNVRSCMLSDGSLIMNTTNNIPASFAKVIKMNEANYWETSNGIYATDGTNLVQIKGLDKR